MIARREFLAKLASLPAAKALAFQGISVVGYRYSNVRIGLEVERPVGWEFSSIADFAALRERQVLEEPEEIYDGPHPLKDPENLPAFLFECSEFKDGDFCPCITLYDEALLGPTPIAQEWAHEMMLDGFGNAYRNLKVRVSPQIRSLKGATATFSVWSYDHVLDTGEIIPLSVRSLLVFREPRVNTYHLVDSAVRPCIDESVWEAFITSIRYVEVKEPVLP